MRASDRIEAFARVVAVLVLLVAVPVAGAVGTASYTAAAEHIRADNATKMAVQATLITTPVLVAPVMLGATGDSGHATAQATVRWVRQGRTGQATVEVPDNAVRGAVTGIWLGPHERPTTAPISTGSAGFHGFAAGFMLLVVMWVAVAIVFGAVRWMLNQRRGAAWAREWFLVARPLGRDHR